MALSPEYGARRNQRGANHRNEIKAEVNRAFSAGVFASHEYLGRCPRLAVMLRAFGADIFRPSDAETLDALQSLA
jgi:hypothetical protein